MTRMMDLIADARRIAYGSMADQLNFLAEEAPLGAAELKVVMDPVGITPGMVLSSGLNVYYVTGVVTSEKKVLVYPTYDNSKSDALAAGAPIMIRPRVTDWALFNDVNTVIRSLSSSTYGLYREGSWTTTLEGVWNTYPIPADAQDMTNLIRASVRQLGYTDDAWFEVPPNSIKWQPEHNVIRFTSYYTSGHEVRFDYKAPFKQATALTDDVVVDLGLAETMTDIPPLGAAIKLLRTTESRRSNIHAQGDPRRPDEVPGGMNTSAGRDLDREFRQRVSDEHIRLVNRNPWVRQL